MDLLEIDIFSFVFAENLFLSGWGRCSRFLRGTAVRVGIIRRSTRGIVAVRIGAGLLLGIASADAEQSTDHAA